MYLIKTIPAQTQRYEFAHILKGFAVMTLEFCRADLYLASGPPYSCFMCDHRFVGGDLMSVGCMKVGLPVLLCVACASSPSEP